MQAQNPRRRAPQRGAAMTEMLIVFPILLLIALGSVQMAFIYEAKATLNHATFMAARAGAVNSANSQAMRRAFARGMLPLYSPPKDISLATGAKALLAYAEAQEVPIVAPGLPDAPLGVTQMRIINPTRDAFDEYGENIDGERVIPNDRLQMRDSRAIDASLSGVNIQDANLLKLRVMYGYELKIPFINRVLVRLARWRTTDITKQVLLRRGRLPIVSTATVRMQSAAGDNGLYMSREDVDKLLASDRPPVVFGSEPGWRPWQSGPTGTP